MKTPAKALLLGHFSTAGDIECLQVVQGWLAQSNVSCDVAPYRERIRAAISGAVDPRRVDPAAYGYLIVVCGPCWQKHLREQHIDLGRFDHCLRIGVNVTMLEPVADWNPFDVLIERDSDRVSRPDLAFLQRARHVPVAGRCLIERQDEYGSRQRHDLARRRINELIVRRGFAYVDIDTRYLGEAGIVRGPDAVSSVMERVDLLLTTRLHGIVYALRADKPVIALDPVSGGDKVIAQARCLGWPQAALAEDADARWLDEAADWCLSPAAAGVIRQCRSRAAALLCGMEEQFLAALQSGTRSRSSRPAGRGAS